MDVYASSSLIASADVEFARKMLEQIAFIRAFEAKAQSLSQTKPPTIAGSMHLCAGQEAVPVGAMAALAEVDRVVATYRGHGWALASGLDPLSVFAELCHRAAGVNGGRAGSAFILAPSTRFVGENSIVGAGTTIACGLALACTAAKNSSVVVVSIGDGALNQGSVHEAFAFAVVKQLPVVFVVENNGWSELTATEDMFPIPTLATRGGGYGMYAATINGSDPIEVRNSVRLAAEMARRGEGPSLLEFRVPRLWGHYNLDLEHYRPKTDREEAQARDPLICLGQKLIACGIMNEDEVAAVENRQTSRMDEIARNVLTLPLPDIANAKDHVVASPNINSVALPVLETKELTFIQAVNLALRTELENDPRTLVYGEDVGKAGGIFGASRYLQRDFGSDRVFDMPIAENAILGSAVGAAIAGLKPIVEIMWADFLLVALDQLVNQAANIRYVTRGATSVPIVVRTQQGATPGSCAQHSQCVEAILAHVPGLKVALAASATDAYALLRAAAADPDPCIIIESRSVYQVRAPVHITAGAEPVGRARVRRKGRDVAIVTWGAMVEHSLSAAAALASEGIEAGVLDLRWLNPLDETTLENSVLEAGGRVLVVHEAVRTGGFAGEVLTRIRECMPEQVLALRRLTTPDVRIPASPILQAALIPGPDSICEAVRQLLKQDRA